MTTLLRETETHWFTWSGVTITLGQIDDAAVEAFTEGDCHVFATAMRNLTGFDILAVCALDDNGEPSCQEHFVVRVADDLVADIEGVVPAEQLLHRWKLRALERGSGSSGELPARVLCPAEPLVCSDRSERADMDAAVTVARRFIEQHLGEVSVAG